MLNNAGKEFGEGRRQPNDGAGNLQVEGMVKLENVNEQDREDLERGSNMYPSGRIPISNHTLLMSRPSANFPMNYTYNMQPRLGMGDLSWVVGITNATHFTPS